MKYFLLLLSFNCFAETYTTTQVGSTYTTTINQSHESGAKPYKPELKPICTNNYSQMNWFQCLNSLKINK